MIPYEQVSRWDIPEVVMAASLAEMAIDGRHGNEGVALWLGRRDGGVATVSHVLALRGPGVRKKHDLLIIDSAILNDVTDYAIENNVSLVGQIHSHGTFYGTDLSRTDRLYGITVPDYLSLVAPHYAQRPDTRITDCGIHVFRAGVGYVRLSPPEIARCIHVLRGQNVEVAIIGGH